MLNKNDLLDTLSKNPCSLKDLGVPFSTIRDLRNQGFEIHGKNTSEGRIYWLGDLDKGSDYDESVSLAEIKDMVERCNYNYKEAAQKLDMNYKTVYNRYQIALENLTNKSEKDRESTKIVTSSDSITINYHGTKITDPEELIKDANIDLTKWEIDQVVVNNWEVGGKINQGQQTIIGDDGSVHTKWLPQKLWKTPLRQIRIRFKLKSSPVKALESLLLKLEEKSPIFKPIDYKKPPKATEKLSLEISIVDPHFGMMCFQHSSDHTWSMEQCEEACMWAIDSLVQQSLKMGHIEEIVFPFGNDFLHHDNFRHETTGGTLQPEGLSYHHIYERGEALAINMIEKLKSYAPVRVLQIPGNHDRQSSFTLGRLLQAYYRNDANVSVDASSSPYKFYRFGTNLIGFEHGNAINSVRLAAIMANERRQDWAETSYREWHLGDQHRKGSSKPSSFEEQGVSIEYLPSLTAPNEWHRLKGFNWQKRGAMAFLWDYHQGLKARFQVNIDSYTGKPTGKPSF